MEPRAVTDIGTSETVHEDLSPAGKAAKQTIRPSQAPEKAVNDQHRAIRALLQTMAPRRAVDYIRSFQLPEDEELFLIECDVRGKSYIQVAEAHHTTPEAIKRRRRRAYAKIADFIQHT